MGYASVSGLAWLSEHVTDRPVRVFIGNAQHRRFQNADAADRVSALAFLNRTDVQVWNWYRKHGTPAEAHMKAWIVEGTPPAVLTGSANLTSAGLFNNRETMVESHGPDSASVVAGVNDLIGDAWDHKQKLIKVIGQPRAKHDNTEQSNDPVPTRPDNTGHHQPRSARGERPIPHSSKPNLWRLVAVVAGGALVAISVWIFGGWFCSQEGVKWLCDAIRDGLPRG